MTTPFLLYGSYGYTGALIADLAVKNGMRPILAGRDAVRLKAQADRLGLEHRPFSLDDLASLEAALKEVPLVLNCAGPFQHTYQPVLDACLRTGRHYLDITGEIAVFEALAAREAEARQAGVMLLPGVGFDVVPSDCLAAHLKQRLPDATNLILAISTLGGGLSRGTALTMNLADQSVVRKDGKLVQVPMLGMSRQVDFGSGPRTAINIPWGDVSTAYYSTGIPNIEVYMVLSKKNLWLARLKRMGIATKPLVQKLVRQVIMKSPPGPTAEARKLGRCRLWGEVTNDHGEDAVSQLETPDGYSLTAETSLAIVSRVLAGQVKPGFQTPAMFFGADFILEFEGVSRQDL